MSDEILDESIVKFLKKDGAMGILLMIDNENGTIHQDFMNLLAESRGTVSTRLKEANKLDLIKIQRTSDDHDHGNAKPYVLTQMGRVIQVALESMGVGEIYERYAELDRELEAASKTMEEWIYDHEEVWLEKDLGSEFKFREELKNKSNYPGEDVPEDFISFIEGELSDRERVERGLEATERVEPELGDATEERDGEDSEDGSEDS